MYTLEQKRRGRKKTRWTFPNFESGLKQGILQAGRGIHAHTPVRVQEISIMPDPDTREPEATWIGGTYEADLVTEADARLTHRKSDEQ